MSARRHTYIARRVRIVNAPRDAVFRVLCRTGGDDGWFRPRWMWQLRGWMDRMIGGPGLETGRRHPERLHVDDIVECWRVAAVEPPARLELHALMKLSGRGRLEFALAPHDGSSHATRIEQTASFVPNGIWGTTYWFVLLPAHHYVFSCMIRAIAQAAEREARLPLTASRRASGSPSPPPAAECESIDRT